MDVFYRDAPNFHAEALHQHWPNMLSFQVVSGGRRWFVSGCYLAPDNAVTIKCVVGGIEKRTRREVLLMAREFNTDLAAP